MYETINLSQGVASAESALVESPGWCLLSSPLLALVVMLDEVSINVV